MMLLVATWKTIGSELFLELTYTEGGIKKIVKEKPNILPYFWMKANDFNANIDILRRYQVLPTQSDDNWIKCSFLTPTILKECRDKIGVEKCHESDITFVERWLIDNDLHLTSPKFKDTSLDGLKILYFDIECYNKVGQPNPTRDPILSIAVHTREKDKPIIWTSKALGSEAMVIQSFLNFISTYHVISGWNSEEFDLPYILERCKVLKIDTTPLRHVVHLDLMALYSRFVDIIPSTIKSISRRLEDVASHEINLEKIKLEVPIWQIYEQDYMQFLTYAERDVEILKRLDEKYKLILVAFMLTDISGTLPEDAIYYSKHTDALILREARKQGFILKSKPKIAEGGKYSGAKIFESVPGIHSNIAEFDFNSLYPTVVMTFNISFDTLTSQRDNVISIPSYDTFFRKDKVGIVPKILFDLLMEKQKLKEISKKDKMGEMRYTAVKALLNAMYGYFGYRKSRIYEQKIAESITAASRYVITKTHELFAQRGLKPLYGDTDSTFISYDSLAHLSKEELLSRLMEEKNDVLRQLNEDLKRFGVEQSFLDLNLEILADIAIFFKKESDEHSAKKKYILRRIYNGRWLSEHSFQYTGIELVRRDFCALARETITNVIKQTLNKEDSLAYLKEIKSGLFSGKYDSKLVIGKSVREKYKKAIPAHAQILQRLSPQERESYLSMRITFIYGGYDDGKLIAYLPEEFNTLNEERKQIAYQYYWVMQIKRPLERFFNSIGISLLDQIDDLSEKDVKQKKKMVASSMPKQTTLEVFES